MSHYGLGVLHARAVSALQVLDDHQPLRGGEVCRSCRRIWPCPVEEMRRVADEMPPPEI